MEPKFMSGQPTDPACIYLDKNMIKRDYRNFTTPFVSKLDHAQSISSNSSLLFLGGRSSIFQFFESHPGKPIIEAADKNLGAMSFTFTNSPIDLYKKLKNYTLIPSGTIAQKRDVRVRNSDGSRKTWKQAFHDVNQFVDQGNATYTVFEIFQAEGARYDAMHRHLPHLVFHTARDMSPWTVLGVHMAELFFATLQME